MLPSATTARVPLTAPAENARPGDVIEYVATYLNTTAQPVRNLEATLPIPANTEILLESTRPNAAIASSSWSTFVKSKTRPFVTRVTKSALREAHKAGTLHSFETLYAST